ncbi:hypothetical protein GXP71_17355 [Cellulomonas sp. H30R-01]|uniref:Uncharacterized protein n=1 Tax=Cellulomonas algicola TaxID=2071633 RepID=A0A401V0R8_9CELL|nr:MULTISPECIES: hypothetical protein [Cellulomonas]QHT57667.1 hypothetical protein GXP71_17355 [Cellulomonas sp. H30R-01]GCD20496.1 hypothetical protein CTKZ_20580 [Cellulomonas algicola]
MSAETAAGAAFDLPGALEPLLAERGFTRGGPVFRGRSGDVAMVVRCEPQARVDRVRTITVECTPASGERTAGERFVHQFNQAATAFGWRGEYTAQTPGFPQVIVDDFTRLTLPFVDRATSVRAIAELVLDGEVPPSDGRDPLLARVTDPYEAARRFGWPDLAARAVEVAEGLDLDWRGYEAFRKWADYYSVDVRLRKPRFSLRHSVDRFLPLQHRRYA